MEVRLVTNHHQEVYAFARFELSGVSIVRRYQTIAKKIISRDARTVSTSAKFDYSWVQATEKSIVLVVSNLLITLLTRR